MARVLFAIICTAKIQRVSYVFVGGIPVCTRYPIPDTRNPIPETRNLIPDTRNLTPETRNLIAPLAWAAILVA